MKEQENRISRHIVLLYYESLFIILSYTLALLKKRTRKFPRQIVFISIQEEITGHSSPLLE